MTRGDKSQHSIGPGYSEWQLRSNGLQRLSNRALVTRVIPRFPRESSLWNTHSTSSVISSIFFAPEK
jgi:hypothetical protein